MFTGLGLRLYPFKKATVIPPSSSQLLIETGVDSLLLENGTDIVALEA